MRWSAVTIPLPLALDPAVNASLHALLDRALPIIREQAAALQPILLVLMGSASAGEASAVHLGDRTLPLSDLDLGLFVKRPVGPAERGRLRVGLREALAPAVRELGLTHDPIDLGIYEPRHFARMPLTLELASLVSRPCVLWGDPSCVIGRAHEAPGTFEPLRLVLNRITEAALPPGGPTDPDWLEARPPQWAAEAGPSDWRVAHRYAKLVLDLEQAHIAAHGLLIPSIRERDGVLDAPGEARWSKWRLEPSWPPPEFSARETAGLASRTMAAVTRQAGLAEFDPGDRGHWRRLLGLESGGGRERLRRWARLLRARPSGPALRHALPWAGRAWPASFAALAVALSWIDAAGGGPDGEGERLRALLVREAPSCQDLPAARWDESWARALGAWVEWVRVAGG